MDVTVHLVEVYQLQLLEVRLHTQHQELILGMFLLESQAYHFLLLVVVQEVQIIIGAVVEEDQFMLIIEPHIQVKQTVLLRFMSDVEEQIKAEMEHIQL
jgi:hypothetical protein